MKRIDFKDCVGVKVFYADGTVLKWPMGQIKAGWATAPEHGVQVVAIYHKNGRAAWFANYDYYALTRDELVETNLPGELPEGAVVKMGSEMDKDAFRALYNAAMKEPW